VGQDILVHNESMIDIVWYFNEFVTSIQILLIKNLHDDDRTHIGTVHYRYAFLANAFTPHEHAKTFAIRKHRQTSFHTQLQSKSNLHGHCYFK